MKHVIVLCMAIQTLTTTPPYSPKLILGTTAMYKAASRMAIASMYNPLRTKSPGVTPFLTDHQEDVNDTRPDLDDCDDDKFSDTDSLHLSRPGSSLFDGRVSSASSFHSTHSLKGCDSVTPVLIGGRRSQMDSPYGGGRNDQVRAAEVMRKEEFNLFIFYVGKPETLRITAETWTGIELVTGFPCIFLCPSLPFSHPKSTPVISTLIYASMLNLIVLLWKQLCYQCTMSGTSSRNQNSPLQAAIALSPKGTSAPPQRPSKPKVFLPARPARPVDRDRATRETRGEEKPGENEIFIPMEMADDKIPFSKEMEGRLARPNTAEGKTISGYNQQLKGV